MATTASRSFAVAASMWTPCRERSFRKMLFQTHRKDDAMRTELYWVPGPWPGRLAIMPRPRGGDWVDEEIQSWRRTGVDRVVSLLTPDEVADLSLADEEGLCRVKGIQFFSFPIIVPGTPSS